MRILLADDHALFRSGMRYLLSELDGAVEITEASSKAEATECLARQDYDLILTDLLMPGMNQDNGVAAFKAIKPGTPVVVVSMLDSSADVRSAVAAGAAGFIPKSTTPEVMIEAIKLVLSGGVYLPPTILRAETPAHGGTNGRTEPPRLKQLSRRQSAVLAELVLGKSNKEIAYSLNLSEATVKVHIAAIMRALNAQNRTQAVLAAVQHGLLPAASASS